MTQPWQNVNRGPMVSAEAKTAPAVRAGGTWYFVLTVVSAGLLAAVPFWHAWSRLRRPKLRTLAIVYTALDIYLVVLLALTPSPATDTAANDAISTIGGLSVIAVVVVACIQLRGIRRSAYAASPVAAWDEDPAVARVLAARHRREEARKIWASDPGLAHELGIGRPDLKRGFDDGGLVDLNAAPASVISSVCGIDQRHTDAIVKARDARDGQYYNLDELFVDVPLPEDVQSGLKERAVV